MLEIEKTKTTKADLTSALRDAFAYCNRAYSALNDENAHETVKAFGQERNRLGVFAVQTRITWSTMAI